MQRTASWQYSAVVLLIGAVAWVSLTTKVRASSWNGIEVFKSRRDDVIKILGNPISETSGGVLRFTVAGGTVTVSFVDEKFVTTKQLRPELAGTVLEIVLQHEHSSDTPESMNLLKNREFASDQTQNMTVFRSNKSGIVYTFVDGKLRTTRFTFSERQLGRARR